MIKEPIIEWEDYFEKEQVEEERKLPRDMECERIITQLQNGYYIRKEYYIRSEE